MQREEEINTGWIPSSRYITKLKTRIKKIKANLIHSPRNTPWHRERWQNELKEKERELDELITHKVAYKDKLHRCN